MKLWVQPESKSPSGPARRCVEQQREQRAGCGAQQQHAEQRQQQYWLSLCEGDSRGSRFAGLSGQSAQIHGSPRWPIRKPTGCSLFPVWKESGTNKHAARGLVTTANTAENVPVLPFNLARLRRGHSHALQALVLLFVLLATLVHADTGSDVSGNFLVDTRYGLASGANVSLLLTIDTRFSGSSGSAVSGLFAVDTLNAVTPSVAVAGRVTATSGVGLPAAMVQAVINNRVQATASSDFDGYYVLPLLPPGAYELRATRPTFLSDIKRGVPLSAGQAKVVNFVLAPPLVPPSVLPIARQIEATQLPVVTSSQLRIWNGSTFATGLSLDGSKMTIVLTHGYISSSDDWPTTMAQHLTGAGGVGGAANVVAWDWHVAAASTPGLSYSSTRREGEKLALTLEAALTSGYTKQLHFIGHSLGTMVNASAANDLHASGSAAFSPEKTHMTLLDNAALANVAGPVIDATVARILFPPAAGITVNYELSQSGGWVSAVPREAVWIDNYISIVGLYQPRAVNVALALSAHYAPVSTLGTPNPITMHSYAHLWYDKTVQKPYDSPLGHRFSFERLGGYAFLTAPPWPQGTLLVQNVTGTELSLHELFGPAEVAAELKKQAQAVAVKTAQIIDQSVQAGVQFVGNVTASFEEKAKSFFDQLDINPADQVAGWSLHLELQNQPGSAGNLVKKNGGPAGLGGTNVSAGAWFAMNIPSNAVCMTFDFTVHGDGSNDCLVFGINGTNQFALETRFIPPDVEQNSGVIDVAQLAGMPAEFFFGIVGGTSTNAIVAVDGIRFYTLEKPVLSAQPAGNQLVLSWPLSASDFVLETSPALSFSNVWTVVTNVPSVAEFQFSLTNFSYGQNGFFRLRKP